MGCACGSKTRVKTSPARPDPAPVVGDWVAVYPSGEEKTFTGKSARRDAERTALGSGGRFYEVAPGMPRG